MQLLALLLALLPGISGTAPESISQDYFDKACEYSKLDCTGLKAPLLLAIDTPPGLMGFHYYGTKTVYVTDRCFLDVADRTKCDAVVIHEMVHYIASELGKFKDAPCSNEAMAWAVFNLYVLDKDRADLVNGDWRRAYPQCRAKSQ